VALEDGNRTRAEQAGREALSLWSPLALVYPFQWLALLPLAAAAAARGNLAEAIGYARATLAPGQQRLPAELGRALEDTDKEWGQGSSKSAEVNLEKTLVLSRRFGYL
jgi:hypothetical protein